MRCLWNAQVSSPADSWISGSVLSPQYIEQCLAQHTEEVLNKYLWGEWMGLEFSYELDPLTTFCEVVIALPVFLHSTYGVKHQMTIHWFVKCPTPSLDCRLHCGEDSVCFLLHWMSWPNLAQSQDEVSIFWMNAGLGIWMWTQDVGRSQGKGWVLVSWSFQVQSYLFVTFFSNLLNSLFSSTCHSLLI